jgi:hypothetical protein
VAGFDVSSLRSSALPVVLAVLTAVPSAARAQETDSRATVWGSVGLAASGEGFIAASYQPTLLFGVSEAGSAWQTVTIGRDAGWQVSFGGDMFLSSRAGLETWVTRASAGVAATSSDYSTALRYVSRPPPTGDPILVDVTAATPWGPVTTSVTRWTTAVNGVGRWRRGRLGGTVSGGLALVHVSGTAAPLGYTTFVLGGHSTLVSNDYQLATEFVPVTVVGGNVGGSFDIGLSGRASLTLTARQVIAPAAHPALRVASVDRAQAGFDPPSPAEITAQLRVSTLSLPTSAFHVGVGLKVGL